ncbi:hypothetical protein QT327_21270 [Olivibacter sp. 47]|uniref:hypothetical protein n=1 Tax=Olivibacter sp. 47 TaxID=3056486 RepID=UPI0025A38D9C|nr:hypothetical protein [Olivibacter sp. 47]MDM8176847.1 hypothetical protein [Olivibacter sp. 47]
MYEKREVKNVAFLLLVLVGALVSFLFFSSCGSRKKTISTREAISETVTETKGVDVKSITETRQYGERLTGSIPVKILHSDSSNVVIESKGGKLTLSNKGGSLNFDLEAKPTTTTNSYNEGRLTADSTTSKATENKQVIDETRKGFTLPWWGWATIVFAVVLAVYLTLRKLLKHF